MRKRSRLLWVALALAVAVTGLNFWYHLPQQQTPNVPPPSSAPTSENSQTGRSAPAPADSAAASTNPSQANYGADSLGNGAGNPLADSQDQREASRVALGRYLAQRVAQPVWSGIKPVPGVEVWPDIVRILECREQGVAVASVLDEESSLIDAYLFGDAERCRRSFSQLSRVLCYETLDREFYKCADPQHADRIKAYSCPVGGVPYEVASEGLYCPYHRQTLAWPDRTQKPRLQEVYPQLCMGYFNAKRAHRLDEVILGQGLAAVKPGETVVDIGCGVGCYVWAMQRGVGGNGRVIACDVQSSVLDFVRQAARQKGVANVDTLQATYDNPRLASGSVDRVYMIDMLNTMIGNAVVAGAELRSENKLYLARLAAALRETGHLVVVDFLPEGDRPHIPPATTAKVLQGYGLTLLEQQDVPVQPGAMYALTFGKK